MDSSNRNAYFDDEIDANFIRNSSAFDSSSDLSDKSIEELKQGALRDLNTMSSKETHDKIDGMFNSVAPANVQQSNLNESIVILPLK